MDDLCKALWKNDPAFTAWCAAQPDKHWARHDMSALRIGFELGKRVTAIIDMRMIEALELIARQSCERRTTGPGSCWSEPGWTRDAQFTADRWCNGCIALSGLLEPAQLLTAIESK